MMKLQKYLSQSWVCSRRKAEEYIAAGQVNVNGEIAHTGQIVDEDNDVIKLWNKAIEQQKDYVYYKLNKPRGIESTCAQDNTQNIVDIMNVPQRVFPVGRLDKETTGLILMTNDGRLTNFLIHPRYEHEKEYVVETFGAIDDGQLESMRDGLMILWSYTKPCTIERIASGKFSIILTQWKNRQIRRMVEKVWGQIKKLKRIRIENIELWNLELWEYKHISKKEKENLFEKIGLKNS